MLNFTSRTKYFLSSRPTDMRKGREGLAGIVREYMGHNLKCYDEAFMQKAVDIHPPKTGISTVFCTNEEADRVSQQGHSRIKAAVEGHWLQRHISGSLSRGSMRKSGEKAAFALLYQAVKY